MKFFFFLHFRPKEKVIHIWYKYIYLYTKDPDSIFQLVTQVDTNITLSYWHSVNNKGKTTLLYLCYSLNAKKDKDDVFMSTYVTKMESSQCINARIFKSSCRFYSNTFFNLIVETNGGKCEGYEREMIYSECRKCS